MTEDELKCPYCKSVPLEPGTICCPAKEVELLQAEIERLRDGIAGILLLSDDYTRNQNERFAMISTRARKLLKGGE